MNNGNFVLYRLKTAILQLYFLEEFAIHPSDNSRF